MPAINPFQRTQSGGADSTPIACAITSPTAGASLTEGNVVSITGTISVPGTVVVKKGSTTLGSAAVAGLTWSYSYTLLNADVGSLTFNAVATPAFGGSPANAPGVTVTVASLTVSPLVTMATHVKQMFEAATGASTTVWTDQSPSAANFSWAGPAILGSDGNGAYVQSTGSSYGGSTMTLAAPGTTPLVLDVIVQQDSYVLNSPIACLGALANCGIYQTSSGVVTMNNASTITGVTFALSSFKRVRAIFTGATSGSADSIKIGGAAAVTGFAGNNTPLGGFTLGAASGNFFIGKWRAAYLYNAIPSGPQATALDNYYASLYGAGILA